MLRTPSVAPRSRPPRGGAPRPGHGPADDRCAL